MRLRSELKTVYLFRCLLDELMLVQSKCDDHSHELVEMCVVLRVCDAARLDDKQTLERMDYFLNLLPLVRAFANLRGVAPDDLVDALVFFDEDKQEIMRGLAHFCLG
jgi:hypothetical protein